MKSKLLIVLFLSYSLAAFAQKLTVEALNEDFEFFQSALYEMHPSTFRYISEDSLDLYFKTLTLAEETKSTTLALEKNIRKILKQVGCIHTLVTKSVFKHNGTIIPFSLYTNKDSLWIVQDLQDSLPALVGLPLLSINDLSSKDLINEMQHYRSGDGYNESFMHTYLNRPTTFSYLYQYYYDADSIKTYTLLDKNKDTLVIRRKNISPPKIESIQEEYDFNYDNHVFLNLNSTHQFATLKIPSFNSVFPIIGRYINKSRYKKAIKQVNELGYKALVIDLRNNLGGDASAGSAFLSFFVDQSFSYPVKKKKGNFFRYATAASKVGYVLDFTLGHFIAARRPTFKRRLSKVKVSHKKRNHFEGKLLVITNGFTASTASNVASILKYKKNAIIIGAESGGGENDLNAYYSSTIRLPNSKIKVRFPLYHIDLNLTKNTGSGIKPDIPIRYSIEDILSEKDLETAIIRKLLGTRPE